MYIYLKGAYIMCHIIINIFYGMSVVKNIYAFVYLHIYSYINFGKYTRVKIKSIKCENPA